MVGLRRWVNEHASVTALMMLAVLIASGWAIYRYSVANRQTDHVGACCPIASKYGPKGKMGSLLWEAGLKTLALDAVRNRFPKEGLVFQSVKATDVEKGLVEIVVSVNGKVKRLKIDLSVPNGKITELPANSSPHKLP